MKMLRIHSLAVFVLCALVAKAERMPYARYQSIVDRQMFGPLPENFDPTKLPSEVKRSGAAGEGKKLTPEEEKLKSAVKFSVINVTTSGEVEVGFSDLSDASTPMHYFLKVGESQDGWTVEKADADAATVTLSKGEIVLDLSLGNDSSKGDGAIAKKSADSKKAFGSLRARRNFRRAQEEKANKEQEAAAKERREREALELAQEKEAQAAAQEAMHSQLTTIMEELKKAREHKEQSAEEEKKNPAAEESGDGENNDAS